MSDSLNRDYTVISEIGRGQFGVVSKCRRVDKGTEFAVKTINKKSLAAQDGEDRQCLDNEAKILLSLRPNPHVINVFDVYDDAGSQHIVMELCNAADLLQMINKLGVHSEAEARRVMVPLMEAIAHCHKRGVAHRDIKPDNILYNNCGQLKLADFGSGEFFRDGEQMSGLVGTPYYVAPEVVARRSYDEKVDIWSAGVILYILLSGILPFNGDKTEEIFKAVLRGNLRFPTKLFKSVSPEAKDLLRKMICKDVSRRLSAEEVQRHQWMTTVESKAWVGDLPR